ncbi:hypothetical protein RB195_017075 [Necator americanus]|uniref:Uncharacterized protein n=1 Tax=Necator americanus TaxID=51031 RepID=A0ABR1C761_NECAM
MLFYAILYDTILCNAPPLAPPPHCDSSKINSECPDRQAGNKKLEDEIRSGRPTAISFDELKNLAEQHPYESVRYFVISFGCSLSTVSDGLRCLGMVKKPEAADSTGWTPLSLEKKWVLYVNHTHRRAWCTGREMPDPFVKGEIHEKKVMLSVWWEVHGIYRFELLPDNTTVTAEVLRSTAKIGRHPKFDNVRLLHD